MFQILIWQIFVVRLIHHSVKSSCGLSNVGVMASSEKQRLKHLLVETIHVLCKNSLPDKSSFCIEATIGITLSSDDVMVISFKERVNSDGSHTSLMVTDEQDCDHLQLQPSKKTSDETENHRHISRSRSSCSAGNNNNVPVWKLVSGDATVCQQAEISRTENKSKPTDHNVRMLEDNIIANSGLQLHRAVFGGTDVSSANHCSLPVTDQSYTVSQSSADYEVDSQDDVVIFKVEEAGDIAATVSGMQQFDTEVAAPPVQSRSDVTKNKHRLARFDGNMLDNRSSQSTSAFLETNEMQHVDGPRPWMTTFDVSYSCVHFSLLRISIILQHEIKQNIS